jgi:hypothetical protein
MKQIIFLNILFLILISCGNENANKNLKNQDSDNSEKSLLDKSQMSENDNSLSEPFDYFNDTLFSFLNVDSLSGSFLSDRKVKTFFYNFKTWKEYHFEFFKTKSNYYDFGCYLISKQTNLDSNFIAVIDLRCPPVDANIGYLYTINKANEIMDSIEVVSSWISGNEMNEYYYKGETNSIFDNKNIRIEKITYTCYQKSDSCFIERKEIIKAKIESTGKIKILERIEIKN